MSATPSSWGMMQALSDRSADGLDGLADENDNASTVGAINPMRRMGGGINQLVMNARQFGWVSDDMLDITQKLAAAVLLVATSYNMYNIIKGLTIKKTIAATAAAVAETAAAVTAQQWLNIAAAVAALAAITAAFGVGYMALDAKMGGVSGYNRAHDVSDKWGKYSPGGSVHRLAHTLAFHQADWHTPSGRRKNARYVALGRLA